MQDPNEDTEWNDILRAKGILPPKKEKEITEDDIIGMIENTIEEKQNHDKDLAKLGLDELDELEDSEDEAVLQEYRQKRIAELKQLASRARFGNVLEISGQDYVDEVTKAGEGIYVVLHLYSRGVPFCSLLNQHMTQLAIKFPATKFIRAIATTCIPNYPERNLPTIFVYYEGQMQKQLIGSIELGGPNLTCEELEYILGQTKAIETNITEDPRKARAVKDKMFADLADSNDW
ncbi:viral IAP-associated factor homolog [Toxorhynchites rutilus septentrionalis]|uniref:viral IAP-associated factor homolog n=1 Tax=Toxorhynchites rutilus septentrionalis TaxID=329112 RepID=UPI0024785720|nr:viral IAP-associated factor homolog [Toxorhynchites rutilus septentrionalis]